MKLEDLKVGNYIRTPLGIAKYLGNYKYQNLITGKIEKTNMHEFDKLYNDLWSGDVHNVVFDSELKDIVLKASDKLIDLIEVGDYVNGKEVIEILKETIIIENYGEEELFEQDIKSIVTKKLFENVAYKVEE